MATPEQKAAAGMAALQRLQLTQPDLAKKIGADWSAAKLTYSSQVRSDVAAVKETATRAALVAWFSDPKAVAAWTKAVGGAVGGATSDAGKGLAPGVGAVGGLPQGVGTAVGEGLANSFQGGVLGFLGALTSANTWLRVGEVVLGLLLIVAGVVKLTGPGVLKATPVGRIAKAL